LNIAPSIDLFIKIHDTLTQVSPNLVQETPIFVPALNKGRELYLHP